MYCSTLPCAVINLCSLRISAFKELLETKLAKMCSSFSFNDLVNSDVEMCRRMNAEIVRYSLATIDEVEVHDVGKQLTDFEKENLLLLSTGNPVSTRVIHSHEACSESHVLLVFFSTTPLPVHRMRTRLPRRYAVIRCN